MAELGHSVLGFEFEGEAASPSDAAATSTSFGFTHEDIQEMASGLGPGESATPEAIRAVEPELAAMSDAIAEMEREGAQV